MFVDRCAHGYVCCVYFSGQSDICGLRSYRVTYAEDSCRRGVNRSFVVTAHSGGKMEDGFSALPVCACFGGRADDWLFLSALFLRFEVFFSFSQCYIVAGLRYDYSEQG